MHRAGARYLGNAALLGLLHGPLTCAVPLLVKLIGSRCEQLMEAYRNALDADHACYVSPNFPRMSRHDKTSVVALSENNER